MKFPLKWLLELCPFDGSTEKIARLLTESGSEVEDIQRFSDRLSGVVVGEITGLLSDDPLPGMFRCTVKYGSNKRAQVISRAPNLKIGGKYPFAPIGATLFGGKRIDAVEFEGVRSEGMLCSGVEIGLDYPKDKLLELRADTAVGDDIIELLGWDDDIFELEITPNRPDCYGILGLARELSALTGVPLNDRHNLPVQIGEEASKIIKIEIADPSGCPRYTTRIVEGITVGPSPLDVMGRLSACGVRPINNVVDATNYVMFMLSHPLHAFDLDRLDSDTIVVRSAREGEIFTTLDGEKRKLSKDFLMIATPERPVAIAGVMGGMDSEVTDDTKRILIESAYFNPRKISRISRSLNLVTESSIRFERGVDPNRTARAADECAALMASNAGGEVRRGIVDEYPDPIEPLQVRLSPKKIRSVIGVDIPEKVYASQLSALGFERSANFWIVPTFRPDVTREIDLVEEVGRLYGYHNIKPELRGAGPIPAFITDIDIARRKASGVLCGLGFNEVMSDTMVRESDYEPFSEKRFVHLENPVSSDYAVMRTMIVPGLLRIADYNLNRESEDIRLYEIDKVFFADGDDYNEKYSLGIVMAGAVAPEDWGGKTRELDIFDFKGAVEHLMEALMVQYDIEIKQIEGFSSGKSIELRFADGGCGVMGMVSSKIAKRFDIEIPIYAAEIPLKSLIMDKMEIVQFAGIPRFPSTRRDVALIVDSSISAGDILSFAKKHSREKLERVFIFDLYEGKSIGEGKKSVGLAAIFRDSSKTITDIVANGLHANLVDAIVAKFDAKVRQ